MKLLLISSGLCSKELKSCFKKALSKPVGDLKVLFLFGVNSNEEFFYVNESKKELISIGIREKNIFDLNFFESFEILESDFDVVYVCGGNTFEILNSLRKNKLDLLIEKILLNNGVYVGVSAGSIIVGPSIKIAGWGSEGDLNNIGLKNLGGFCFVDFSLYPHYRDELKKEVEDFKKIVDYPVFVLRDCEGIYFEDGKRKFLRV